MPFAVGVAQRLGELLHRLLAVDAAIDRLEILGAIEHQLGGAVGRIGHDETAFDHRNVEYTFMSIGQCADQSESEACTRWAREFWEAMQPYSTGGVYVNYLGQEADEGADRIKAAYGPEKYQKLTALKTKYDPANMFRLNQNIRPR